MRIRCHQPAQMAGRRVRLPLPTFAMPTSDSRHVEQSELSASAADGQVKNYRDWGIALGRRFRALKLWFLIREQGVTRLQTRLRRDLANAQWLRNRSIAAPLAAARARGCRPFACAMSHEGRRRRARSAYAVMVRANQSLRPRLFDAGGARRPLDGPRVDRQ